MSRSATPLRKGLILLKMIMAAAAVAVYIILPGYRYYVIGTWIGYKILHDKPRRYRIIAKDSKLYNRLTREVG